MTPGIRFTAAVLGTPDPRGLARFYRDLLGWPIRDDTDDWATLRPGGGPGLSFQLERDHVPPVWPQEPGVQQMQTHLDFEVDDLATACAHAESVGARRIGGYTDADEDVAVFADPAGHPFCLFVSFS